MIQYKVYHFVQSIKNILFKKKMENLCLETKRFWYNNMCKLYLFTLFENYSELQWIDSNIDNNIYLTSTKW